MDIDELRQRDTTLLLDEELPREAARLLLDRLLALRVFARSAWEDAVESLDDEPLADAVPHLRSRAFDTVQSVIAAIDAAYDAADALHAAIYEQGPDLGDPIDPRRPPQS